ncbi:MAG: restriction endonuclease subunit S [Candidatus Cloacimonetes bacterium]|nr:restriction endonuclease subunit S [Candidatus Cloacimonadota bacterium]
MSEWRKSYLCQLAEIIKGDQVNSDTLDQTGKYPVINGGIEPSGYLDRWNRERESITISEGGNSCGYVSLMKQRFWSGGHCYTLKNVQISNSYLYHYLKFIQQDIMKLRVGSGLPNIQRNDIDEIEVYYPLDDQEQIRIAIILSTVDEVIEKTEAAIDKYQAIKAGMMQDLFTRGIDTQTGKLRPTIEEAPELYKESKLGWIPKEWDVTDFDDVIKEYFDFRGKTPLKLGMNWGGGSIKAISANNIEPGFINFNKEHYLASEDLYRAWMNHGDCSKGDVVMTSEAPLGVVAQIPDNNKYILSQRVFLFKVKPSSITNDYLYYLMNTDRFQNDLQRQSSGSTVTGIQQARLARIRMQLTRSLEEQLHISKILKSIDLGISDNKEMLSKYKNLKHGLMADLLTGKVRVNLNDNKVEKG